MPSFQYVVQDPEGKTSDGIIESASADEAAVSLQTKGYFVLAIQEGLPAAAKSGFLQRLILKPPSQRDLMFFSRELASLLKAGVPLLRALSILSQKASNPGLGKALEAVATDVNGGKAFHQALGRHPDAFPRLLVAMVQAGEVSGQLPTVLKQYYVYTSKEEGFKRKVKGALTYPAILCVVAVAVTLFLSLKVVPTFAAIFKGFHIELPLLTRLVVSFSDFLRGYWAVIIVAAVVCWGLIHLFLGTRQGRLALAQAQRQIPILSGMFEDVFLQRFFAAAALLLSSGVPMVTSLSILHDIFKDNPLQGDAIETASRHITQGMGFAQSLKKTKIFPLMALDSVSVAEEAGSLVQSLEALAEFHGEELDFFTQQVGTIIEPIMIVIVGVMIGFILFSLFMPMFALSSLKPV